MLVAIVGVVFITIFLYTIKKVLSNTRSEEMHWVLALLITIAIQSGLCFGILSLTYLILIILKISNYHTWLYTMLGSWIMAAGIASFSTIKIMDRIVENIRWKMNAKNKK